MTLRPRRVGVCVCVKWKALHWGYGRKSSSVKGYKNLIIELPEDKGDTQSRQANVEYLIFCFFNFVFF